ncbi:glycoside hydrolase family 3 N-terminal domain-containing protein [Demequina sp. SYSU T00192]|uniref:Glycoside hydrolase family 3 N-terminal domain-containing protein n=1 Tax=Demequina litoralis TaxID=3051660 RepID=A0ABT8GAU1_9MICO|nr:glycoside hydrolase family 3 protein [Demequina sp. SYSU T00192]MDN4476261.1 glycoside hydrolase family 3 N-terminal domain-containing protein [Demequina sp. SYSU T00192]
MSHRKEIKQEAVARVKDERAAKRARRDELKAMTPDERTAAKAADRTAARDAKKASKDERAEVRATMNRAERRALKRRERVYRKVKHRPRRAVGWGVTAAAGVGIVVLAAPYVGGLSRVASLTFTDDTAEAAAAREAALDVAESISDEGMVLLKNDGDALPLDGGVNVFSFASFNLRLGGGGSGGTSVAGAPTLFEALEGQGIAYNEDLYATMQEAGAQHTEGSSNFLVQIAEMATGAAGTAEPAPDYLTDDVMAQAAEFSDTAIVVLGASGGEGSDLSPDQLRLTAEERALLDTVTAAQDDVIVVVNSGNQMELGFLDEYPEITAAVWMGTPGPQGAVSLAKVLSGEVNPSGRLTDTYAYDVTSAPGVENMGDHDYTNVGRSFLEYEEGIYVGYRYYETRYADDEAGYLDTVQFPFGHGLGYTDFAWDVAEPVLADEKVTVDVTVTNTGDVAGKDVVQVYFSAPYTDGGIEKSAIELAGYAKTAELAPGASETVTVEFAVQDMASWDTEAGRYVLEAGDYEISARLDVHTPVASSTTTVANDVAYDVDPDTGVAYESRFDYVEGDLTYLSRADWEGTYPTAPDGTEAASDEVLALMDPVIEPAEGDAPAYGADNGLVLADLAGLDYDDPAWDAFLDQLTLDEQIELFSYGAYKTAEVERLGVPSITMLDSPAGLNSLFSAIDAAAYPTEIVVASTWNDELAYALGESVGREASAYGVEVWYAPGMNLHRTALGGRDFEYFSEDPLVSGKMAAAVVSGSQDQGVPTTIKHFVLNDQEVNARSGINVFASEQALRELYLQPFEIAVKEADAAGAMSSFINLGGSWAGGNEDLLQGVLRGEWGFEGFVSTDAVLGSWMDPQLAALGGNDVMLAVFPSATVKATAAAAEADPVGMGHALRDRVHALLFTVAKTHAVG